MVRADPLGSGSKVTGGTHLPGALWKRRYEKNASRTKKMSNDSSNMKRDWTIREFSETIETLTSGDAHRP